MTFYVCANGCANGSDIFDVTLGNLATAESFFHDIVLNLGPYSGPIDLTFGYNLVADGSGGFGFDFAVGGAVPEPSTWAMMLIGFPGLGWLARTRAQDFTGVTRGGRHSAHPNPLPKGERAPRGAGREGDPTAIRHQSASRPARSRRRLVDRI